MNEKPTRDRSVGFTDASYIRQDDAPNMPRCYSFSEEKSSGTKKTVSPLRVGALCLAFFVLGSLLTTAFSDAEKPVVNTKTAVPTPSSETVQTGGDISGAAAISAAVHADTPPSATSAPTGERPYLGVIVQTVSCAAAEYYNGSDSNAMVPGVQIYAVEDGGPASDAGLCSGDHPAERRGHSHRRRSHRRGKRSYAGLQDDPRRLPRGRVPRGAGRARRAARRGRRRGPRLV